MLSRAFIASLPAGKTNSIHIGFELFAVATKMAIDVSSKTGVQIGPSQFVQHLIYHFSEEALQSWSETLKAAALQSEYQAAAQQSNVAKEG